MLTLTRKDGEKIILTVTAPATIEVVVCDCRYGKTRVAIAADPETVKILRAELIDKNKGVQL